MKLNKIKYVNIENIFTNIPEKPNGQIQLKLLILF